ncbi:Outer membrane protein OmpA [Lutibacter oricola]|uniref:Outer membrane protein OmpA n=1 Tax=Lutibacter oricola TaxID=762486 RepID=A0A1H3G2R7_9FLAO|nr:OmpA family protein [Lutibacter oricola]SDX96659.1 Outer membrane protein OmpA [Lutibacter oricola]
MIKKLTILFVVFTAFIAQGQEDRYTVQNLKINDYYSNFGTTFYGENKVVFASPRKKSYIVRNVWKQNNQPFLDLYVGEMKEDGQLKNVKKFANNLNTRYHEADVAFSKDGKTVFFSRNNFYERKLRKDSTGIGLIQLYKADISPVGTWENEEPMPFNNDHYQTGHPTISADGNTLYFISDMPGGFGKTDVYKAAINSDGSIGEAINMGPTINTAGREMFTSISGNDELYFSSDGREDGLGQLDIYVSKLTSGRITEPQNLGKPINSEKDDFSFIINYETRRGYFSSNRPKGKGDDDIYTFIQNEPIEFKCNQIVEGIVTEKNSNLILPGAKVVLYDEKGKIIDQIIVGEDAKFNFEVACNKNYKVIGSKERYSIDEKEFFTTEEEKLELVLAIESFAFTYAGGKCKVRINPIYFDFDKSNIRPDAALELDKVYDVMMRYPEIIIEGGSHTDSRGSYKYNTGLSARRAESTVQYIIGRGISSNRIYSKGYGESELVNGCSNGVDCSDSEHQFNRRTEFIIVNYDEISTMYPEICPPQVVLTKEQIRLIEQEQDILEARRLEGVGNEFYSQSNNTFIKINPIYFDLNSSTLTADAIIELNKVVEVMKKYPKILVESGSHTDSRATNSYNDKLSLRRANATIKYLKSQGVNTDRLYSKGYGETKLINHCSDGVKCLESEHLINRRTEFKILNPNDIN